MGKITATLNIQYNHVIQFPVHQTKDTAGGAVYPVSWSGTIPAGCTITKLYYNFDFKAPKTMYYKTAETDRIGIQSDDWRNMEVDIANRTIQTGSNSAARITFYAAKESGASTQVVKQVTHIELVAEYQTNAMPSSGFQVDTVPIGNLQTLTIYNASPDVTHVVEFSYADGAVKSGEFYLDTATRSVSWAVPQGSIGVVCNSIQNTSTIATGSIKITTYENGNPIGESATTVGHLTMTPQLGAPTLTATKGRNFITGTPDVVEAAAGDDYVQNFSELIITPTATEKYGARISKLTVSTQDGTIAQSPYKFLIRSGVGISETTKYNYDYTITATDTRGFTTTLSGSVKVYPCDVPMFTSTNYYRCAAGSPSSPVPTETDEGGNVYYSFTTQVCNLAKNQNATAVVTIQDVSGNIISGFSNTHQITPNSTATFQGVLGDETHTIDNQTNYTINVTVTDILGLQGIYTGAINTTLYTISRQAGGKGVAFGKIAELYGVEVDPDWSFYTHGEEIMHLLVDTAHPIGSVIQTLNDNFDPNVKWPWTQWGKVEDCFLYANGAKNTGIYGGSVDNGIKANPNSTNSSCTFYIDQSGTLIVQNEQGGTVWNTSAWHDVDNPPYYTWSLGITQPALTENNMPPYLTVNVWVRAR